MIAYMKNIDQSSDFLPKKGKKTTCVAVWMVIAREFAKGPLDFVVGGGQVEVESVVEITGVASGGQDGDGDGGRHQQGERRRLHCR